MKATKRKATTGKQKRSKRQKKMKAQAGDSDDDPVSMAVNVNLERARKEAEEALNEPEDRKQEEEAKQAAMDGPPDPYLLADADYIQKDTRWRNKQRTLVFASRGVAARFRHLTEDIKKLLPHHRAEPKFEKRSTLQEINEICELKSCNNVVFFEARKGTFLYMYLARVPYGPTVKFQVLNVHTTGEVRLAGNCLLGSRPILHFDKHFDRLAELRLIKELLIQAFGTPRNHPKCKPFHDHAMCFYFMDKKIWFRHYQVAPETQGDLDDPEKQALTEIGPRFVLDPIRVLGGSFSGQTLYLNPFYMSPTALRVHARKMKKSPYLQKLKDKKALEDRKEANKLEEDPVDDIFD